MLIKFIGPMVRFRNITEEDFTSIGFDGQPGIRIDAEVMPFIDLPEPVAKWLLEHESLDWARVEGDTGLVAPEEAPPSSDGDGTPAEPDSESKSKKK